MNLSPKIIKDFAKLTTAKSEVPINKNNYGTICIVESKPYVKLDGAETNTPVELAMDAESGDRVIVAIENHKATVIGNLTSPASARTASSFMKLKDDGLVIGAFDKDGTSTVGSTVITSNTYTILDATAKRMGYFTVSNDVFTIHGNDAVGIKTGTAEVLTTTIDSKPVAVMRANEQSKIQVQNENIHITTPNSNKVYINEHKVITTEKSLVMSGRVTASGKIPKNGYKKFGKVGVAVPNGYKLTGIREVRITSDEGYRVCHLTSFWTDPSTKSVIASFHNTGDSDHTIDVTIEWFAILSECATNDDINDTGNILDD